MIGYYHVDWSVVVATNKLDLGFAILSASLLYVGEMCKSISNLTTPLGRCSSPPQLLRGNKISHVVMIGYYHFGVSN